MTAVNCSVCKGCNIICDGFIAIDNGCDGVSLMDACAVLDGSAKLAAVRRIVCKVLIVAGAV